MSEVKHRWSVAELLDAEFPPLEFYVPQILPGGLSLLWGRSKGGKSILGLQLAAAIASGGWALGSLPCKPAKVAYLSFEDGRRRWQKRLQDIGVSHDAELSVFTQFPTGKRGVETLERLLDEEPDTKVVFIDTAQRFLATRDSNDYAESTAALAEVKRIADERDIAVVLIHHSKKMGKPSEDGADWSESAIGSTGYVAAPDHLLFLERTPQGQGDATLRMRSKDADGAELALQFDQNIGGWALLGDAKEIAKTQERQDVLDILRDADGPVKTGEIAKQLGKKSNTVNYLLNQLRSDGWVFSAGYGKWAVFEETREPHEPMHPESPVRTPETTGSTESRIQGEKEDSGDSVVSGGVSEGVTADRASLATFIESAKDRETEAYSVDEPDQADLIEDVEEPEIF